MNNNIDLKKTEKMGYISFWCQKVIPLVFDDSLSYYESVCKFMQKLNEVINALNNNAECIDELQDKYIILQKNFDSLEEKWKLFQTYIENEINNFKTEMRNNFQGFKNDLSNQQENFENTINNEFTSFKTYVENYLDNIDVQSYVNIKIDELVEDGYFKTLLTDLGFNPDNYLAKNNEIEYIPTSDYNPATKKYVDEHSSQGVTYTAGDGIKIKNDTISSENSNIKNISEVVSNPPSNNGVYVNSKTFIAGYNSLNYTSKPQGAVKVLGDENRWGNGASNGNPIIIGNSNTPSGDGINRSIIIGNENIIGHNSKENNGIFIGRNITYKDEFADSALPIVIANPSVKGLNAIEIIDNIIHMYGILQINNIQINEFGKIRGYINFIDGFKSQDIACDGEIRSNNILYIGNSDFILSEMIDNEEYQYNTIPLTWINNDKHIKNLLLNADKIYSYINKYDKQLIYSINYENNVTGDTKLILRNGLFYLNMSVTYPSSISGNDTTLTLFKLNITSSETLLNGFKDFNGIIVNKNDSSSKERTAPIRVVKTSDTEYSVVYVGNTTEEKPYNYTIEFGGVIGYL